MDEVRLYFKLVTAKIASQMQYTSSFVISALTSFLSSFIDVIGLYIIFDRFKMIEGWILPEICLLYGLLHMSFAVVEAFARGFDMFGGIIRTGQFDRVLLRSRSIIVQILGSEFKIANIGRFLQGLIPFIYAISSLNISSLWQVLLMLLGSINACLLFFSLLLFQATFSFWTVSGLEFMNAFTYGGLQMGQYPLSIYNKWFASFFTYIIPIAITVYFPVLLVIHKTSDLYYEKAKLLTALGLPICLCFLGLSALFFRYGVTKYKSTGS